MKYYAIVCDIDGVIADNTHRLNADGEPDWKQFYKTMDKDQPIAPIVLLLELIDTQTTSEWVDVFLVTGRPEEYREVTLDWLNLHGVEYSSLLMRKLKDNRPDYEVKPEMLEEIAERGYDVLFAIEDSPNVVEAYRKMGVLTFDVGRQSTVVA